jgi:hypothetical protein
MIGQTASDSPGGVLGFAERAAQHWHAVFIRYRPSYGTIARASERASAGSAAETSGTE